MGGSAFKQVAAAIAKWDFKQTDEVPRNYDQQPFHIDGKIDVNIEFGGKTMLPNCYFYQKVCAGSRYNLLSS